MALRYVTVDVFSDFRFGGNQLSVVLDAGGLDEELMQAIASEFSYAETTFVRPPADAANTAEVRIFTPKSEVPFAGHPNVGTAFALARIGEVFGKPVGETVRFEEKAGLVPVEIHRDGGDPVGARLTSPQPFELGDPVRADVIAACCGIEPSDIATHVHEPCKASCGLPWVFACAASPEVVARARPNSAAFAEHLPASASVGIELYAPVGGTAPNGADCTARVFAPEFGVTEDAATGSANVTLAGLLAALDPAADATLVTTISQGVEMGRPSLLIAEADKADGAVTATRIGGRCVPVMDGSLTLD
jgi:trans-2,3-dihydro-3-hydroxyanthranilate isomerase